MLAAEPLERRRLLTVSLGSFGQVPFAFEENLGQTDEAVEFLARGSDFTMFLTASEAVLALATPPEIESKVAGDPEDPSLIETEPVDPPELSVLRMQFAGANPAVQVVGVDELPSRRNYFTGSDPAQWQTDITDYAKVVYDDIYAGIDLVYYGDSGPLQYDFVVDPGTDFSAITLEFEGADQIVIDDSGSLILTLGDVEVVHRAPFLFQETAGVREEVGGRFVFKGDRQIGFEVDSYDTGNTLVIDPTIVYSTYLGGSGNDQGLDIVVDEAGNTYICGRAASTDFPFENAYQSSHAGSNDVFVAKLNSTGDSLAYSTYIGGSGDDRGHAISLDGSGNAVVSGITNSSDFALAGTPLQSSYSGSWDAFVLELSSDGSQLLYSSYFGGSGDDRAEGVGVDGSDNVYFAGRTQSDNLLTANAYQSTRSGNWDAYVAKLDTAAGSLEYSTYLGGGGADHILDIAVDAAGSVYATGQNSSNDFPTFNPFQSSRAGDWDAFVTKLTPSGSLDYSTYLGGSGGDYGQAIAVDTAGNAYVTGNLWSNNFPTQNAFQPARSDWDNEAFVTKLNASGSALVYSTYLGGGAHDQGLGIAVDADGHAYVAGRTRSSDFPTASADQDALVGPLGVYDAFVTKFNTDGSGILYSTYLGGNR